MFANIKTFPVGGIHPHDSKLSAKQPITVLPLPETVSIMLSQHIGAPAVPVVNPGEKVKTGQLIAKSGGFISANLHSSVSGTVLKMDQVVEASGFKRMAFIIKVEGDEWADGIDHTSAIKTEITASSDEIRRKVADAGIVGLGGAAFPTHVKLSVPEGKKADFLLINGVECEPYLTGDHRLMLERAEGILIGVRLALRATGIKKALIGIEANKPDAINHLNRLTDDDPGIEVVPLKVWYPQGGERQLVKALVNREIPPPPKGLPIDVGCVVLNVATCYAIYEAVQKNKPLIERIVTVTGDAVKNPSNFLARIGTPIKQLIDAAGGLPESTGKILSGGPMMGKCLSTMESPVTKGTGGILLVPDNDAHRKEVQACIRCARCVSVCPLGLEPYLLMTLVEKDMLDRAEQEKITNCCECACCSYTCPANRPLLDYIRLGKFNVIQRMRKQEKK
ncbi:MAG: electron transport complex subunit RsxC [Candidatus Omnitrophota bacterium]